MLQHDAENYFPIFDPTGERMLLTSNRDDVYSLRLLDLTTGESRALAAPVSSRPASPSSDGRRVVYSQVTGEAFDIRVLDPETNETEPLISCAQVQSAVTGLSQLKYMDK